MKRPGWLRGSADSSGDDERAESESAAGDRTERAQRERLARARRERAARTRADLAAKTREKDGARGESKRRRERVMATSGERKARTLRRGAALKTGAGLRSALKKGATETRARASMAAPDIAKAVLAMLTAVFGIFFDLVGFLLNVLIAIFGLVAPPIRAVLSTLARLIRWASRMLTPVRALGLVVAGAIVLLALSQYADYRSVSIGTDAYADGIQTVAPAPERGLETTGSAHSYALVPVAALSLLLLLVAMRGRWRVCRLIALGGGVAIVISLLVDRPAGLDPGQYALTYQGGVTANLLGGFYAQLFSGLLLAASALMLGRELRLAGAAKPARRPRGSKAGRAGGRLFRRNPGAEGARA